MFSFIKNLLNREQLNYPDLMERAAIILDVRSPQEFEQGHVEQSLNIPLNDITNHVDEIKQQHKPVIICCRSGTRSAKAMTYLKNEGIEVYNGGSWKQVQSALTD